MPELIPGRWSGLRLRGVAATAKPRTLRAKVLTEQRPQRHKACAYNAQVGLDDAVKGAGHFVPRAVGGLGRGNDSLYAQDRDNAGPVEETRLPVSRLY